MILAVNSLPQRVIDVSSVGLLAADPPPAAQRHQLVSRVGVFLQGWKDFREEKRSIAHSICL